MKALEALAKKYADKAAETAKYSASVSKFYSDAMVNVIRLAGWEIANG